MWPLPHVSGTGASHVCSASFRIDGTGIGRLEAGQMVNLEEFLSMSMIPKNHRQMLRCHSKWFGYLTSSKTWIDEIPITKFDVVGFAGIVWACSMRDFSHSSMSGTKFGRSFWWLIQSRRLPFSRTRNHFIWLPPRRTSGSWYIPRLPSNSVKYFTFHWFHVQRSFLYQWIRFEFIRLQ